VGGASFTLFIILTMVISRRKINGDFCYRSVDMLHSQILSVSTTANAGLTGEDSNNKLTGENTVYV
jgi:hypothetical protein